MTFNYFPNVPNAPDDPADDQPEMQVNTLSIQNLIGVDHLGFNAIVNSIPNSGGFHTVIHLTQQSGNPAAVGTIGQIWSKQVTFNGITDEALFFRPGGASADRITQLTVPVNTNLNENGYAYLPGGILMQWGRDGAITGTVVFPIAYSSIAYNVQLTPHINGASSSSRITLGVETSSITATQFKYQLFFSNVGITSISWVAIGPA